MLFFLVKGALKNTSTSSGWEGVTLPLETNGALEKMSMSSAGTLELLKGAVAKTSGSPRPSAASCGRAWNWLFLSPRTAFACSAETSGCANGLAPPSFPWGGLQFSSSSSDSRRRGRDPLQSSMSPSRSVPSSSLLWKELLLEGPSLAK